MDDLPDEVILNFLSFLKIKELIKCQVSKRLRAIVNDESLWLKLNLVRRQVRYDFIEKAAANGCQYLSLPYCNVVGLTEKSETSFNFKYLNVFASELSPGIKKMIQNCSSLQKLSITNLSDSDDISDLIQSICQSGQTLQVLYLAGSDPDTPSKCFKNLFSNCVHLTEIRFRSFSSMAQIQALVDNLTPTILKVDLSDNENVYDEHVKKLVKRCNKITHLNLSWTSITIDSVHSIIEELKASLEELRLPAAAGMAHPDGPYEDFASFATLLELKSMPALKNVMCKYHAENIETLKEQVPLNYNFDDYYDIAYPFKNFYARRDGKIREIFDEDWIWEIRVKEQNLFYKI